jgi:hypothetical protein
VRARLAGSANGSDQRLAVHAVANFDARLRPFARELDGVGDQVHEYLLHQTLIHLPGGEIGNHEIDVAVGAIAGQLINDALGQFAEAHGLLV